MLLIEGDALKNWTRGSYEWIRSETVRCLRESDYIKEEVDFSFKLLATYPNSCLIVAENGDFHKVHLGVNEDQTRYVKLIEKVDNHPKLYTSESEFYNQKLKKSVSDISKTTSPPSLLDICENLDSYDVDKAISVMIENNIPDFTDNETVRRFRLLTGVRCTESDTSDYISKFLYRICQRATEITKTCNNKNVQDICESIALSSSNLGYWVNMIENEQHPSYRAILGRLIQYVQKIDNSVSYYEKN